ncbi:MAG: hypothetical protein AVDCRST_MAG27-864, partial [uncultured Craurococcus sp.]
GPAPPASRRARLDRAPGRPCRADGGAFDPVPWAAYRPARSRPLGCGLPHITV